MHQGMRAAARQNTGRISVALGAALMLCGGFLPRPAAAAGLYLPDNGVRAQMRGGAFATRADDLTAVHHNPAGLAKLRGTHILYNHTLLWHGTTFTRAPSVVPQSIASDKGLDSFAPVHNESPLFPIGAFLAAGTDFGLEDWTFAVAGHGPNAFGKSSYPEGGGQRWLLTELDSVLLYLSAAAAWRHEDKLGVGLTLSYVTMPWTRYHLINDGISGNQLNPYSSSSEILAKLEVSDPFAWTAAVGAWYRPWSFLELAFSGSVVPVKLDASGDITIHNVVGGTNFDDEQLMLPNSSAALDMTLPVVLRAGLRYIHESEGREIFDVELDVVYEGWSSIDAFNIDLEGQINLYGLTDLPDVVIDKKWRDTLSVRLGGTYNVLEDLLSVSAGGFWEQGATPEAYSHLDFMSFDRLGVGGGVEVRRWGFRFSLAYLHIFQEDREVSEEYAKVFQVRPVSPCPGSCSGFVGVPANAGKFESSFDSLSAGVEYRF